MWVLSEIYSNYNAIALIAVCIIIFAAAYLFATGKWARKENKTCLVVLFAVAFIVRLLIAYNTDGHESDMSCFKAWAANIYSNPSSFYNGEFFADYPPLYMFVLYILGFLQSVFAIEWSSAVFTLLIKLPAILCDMGLAYVLYKFTKNRINSAIGMAFSLMILFNPAVLFNSADWGQVDSVFTFVIFASMYLLYIDKKPAAAAVYMSALMIKPQALLLGPLIFIVFAVDLFKNTKKTLKDIGLSVVFMLAVYTVCILPFMCEQPWYFMFGKILGTAGSYPYGSVNAFNLFAIFGGNFISDAESFLFMSYKTWGIIFIILVIAGIFAIYIKRQDKRDIFMLAALLTAGIFMLGHNMHERYLYPAVIFMLFAAAERKSRRMLFASLLLGLGLFFNEYIVLLFYGIWIPDYIVIPFSIFNLIAFGYSIFAALKGNDGFTVEAIEETDWQAPNDNRMTKKDRIVMWSITAVYAVAAFTNLGSFVIPESGVTTNQDAEEIVLKLDEAQNITQYKYYAGYGEGKFDIYYSLDGQEYYKFDENLKHEYHDMFKWRFEDLNISAKYIKFCARFGNLDLREIALIGANGEVLNISAYDDYGNELYALTDEPEQVPEHTSYMENMYFDEIYHARTAYEYIHGIYPYEITHPPLGKAFIALGTLIFGFNPFGWRFMGALSGVLIIPVMYLLAKRLLKNTLFAGAAALLMAADFMHFAQTRIATIDSYSVLFIMLMYLFMLKYMDMSTEGKPLKKLLLPLFLSGLFFGLGAATKWLCIYAGLGLAILFFYTLYKRQVENKRAYVIKTLLFCVVVFVIIPLCIYCASYIPYFNARENFGLQGIIANQVYMLNYHAYLDPDTVHPFSSHFYTWPLNIRPVYFFLAENLPEGTVSYMSTFGNPLIWWGGILTALYLLGMRKKNGAGFKGLGFVGVGFASQFVPWMFVTREVYIYHYFASLPFLILVIVFTLRDIYYSFSWGRKAVYAYLAVCVAAFIMFYPAISGVPTSWEYSQFLRWLPSWPPY